MVKRKFLAPDGRNLDRNNKKKPKRSLNSVFLVPGHYKSTENPSVQIWLGPAKRNEHESGGGRMVSKWNKY
jgi:hypothetical protein